MGVAVVTGGPPVGGCGGGWCGVGRAGRSSGRAQRDLAAGAAVGGGGGGGGAGLSGPRRGPTGIWRLVRRRVGPYRGPSDRGLEDVAEPLGEVLPGGGVDGREGGERGGGFAFVECGEGIA